jgi:hypothetical protein
MSTNPAVFWEQEQDLGVNINRKLSFRAAAKMGVYRPAVWKNVEMDEGKEETVLAVVEPSEYQKFVAARSLKRTSCRGEEDIELLPPGFDRVLRARLIVEEIKRMYLQKERVEKRGKVSGRRLCRSGVCGFSLEVRSKYGVRGEMCDDCTGRTDKI